MNDAELRSLQRLCSEGDVSDNDVGTLMVLGLQAAAEIESLRTRLADSEAEAYGKYLAVVAQRDAVRTEFERVKADIEKLTKRGPLWMQYGLAKLHAMVDLTDPNDVIGTALTKAGFERVPVATTTGEADAIGHELERLRTENTEIRAKLAAFGEAASHG